MKQIFLAFHLFCVSLIFGQNSSFGIIVDKDGYVNVRQEDNAKSPIKGTIKSGEVVGIMESIIDKEMLENWLLVKYDTEVSLEGFVHRSRVQFLDKLPKIPFQKKQGNTLIFKQGDTEILISTKKVQFFKDIKPYISGQYGELYKGKFAYGFDGTSSLTGDFEVIKFEKVILKIAKKTTEIPQNELENLFIVDDFAEGNGYSCYFDKEKNRVFIESSIGDGAGSIDLLLIFENGKFREKRLFRRF